MYMGVCFHSLEHSCFASSLHIFLKSFIIQLRLSLLRRILRSKLQTMMHPVLRVEEISFIDIQQLYKLRVLEAHLQQ